MIIHAKHVISGFEYPHIGLILSAGPGGSSDAGCVPRHAGLAHQLANTQTLLKSYYCNTGGWPSFPWEPIRRLAKRQFWGSFGATNECERTG